MTETGVSYFKEALEKIKAGEFKEAIELFDEAFNSKEIIHNIINSDPFRVNEWEFLEDISKSEESVKNGSQEFEAFFALSLMFKLTGNNDRRKMFLQKAIEINKNNNRLWREYGEATFAVDEIYEALQHFRQAIRLDPSDSVAFEGIAICYYYLDQPIKAIPPFRKALELEPDNHSIMNRLAFILSETGELQEAKELITKAINLEDSIIAYWDTYACILFFEENYHEALKIFEKILKRDSKDPEISWCILLSLYEALGMHARAKKVRERCQ